MRLPPKPAPSPRRSPRHQSDDGEIRAWRSPAPQPKDKPSTDPNRIHRDRMIAASLFGGNSVSPAPSTEELTKAQARLAPAENYHQPEPAKANGQQPRVLPSLLPACFRSGPDMMPPRPIFDGQLAKPEPTQGRPAINLLKPKE